MGTAYTRTDTSNNIADGNVINASDLDGEFDAIESTLSTSGHTHDGTAGEGGPVTVIGPAQDFVATASVIRPKTDNTLDIGTASLEFKDLFIDGTAHIDVLDVDETASITGVLTTTAATVSNGGGQFNGAINVGVDGTGYDVKFFGDTATNGYMLWDQSTDDLILGSSSRLGIGTTNPSTPIHIVSTTPEITYADTTGDLFKMGVNNGVFRLYNITDSRQDLEIGGTGVATFGGSIDVTGTVTSDGLTVDGVGVFSNASPNIRLDETDTTDLNTRFRGQAGSFRIETTADDASLVGTRLLIDHATGDISFYEDNGTTPKFFWDASAESLGIGTTAPSTALEILSATADQITLVHDSATSGPNIVFANNGGNLARIASAETNTLRFEVGPSNTEAMLIDSSGNVRIGNTTTTITGLTQTNLVVGSATGGEIVAYRDDNAIVANDFVGAFLFGNDDNNATEDHFAGMWAKSSSTNGNMNIHWAGGSNNYEAGTPQMTLDVDGNLLVGTTDTNPANDASGTGVAVGGAGWVAAARDGATSGMFNRLTSDGDIVTFHKDGTTVGSIGAGNGDLVIQNSLTGLRFSDSADAIFPIEANRSTSDGNTDLGLSNARFKDLYLSGGVVFGATGGAVTSKTLDDYEEGTWTPVFSDAATGGNTDEPTSGKRGLYTKIGRQVTVTLDTNDIRTVGMTAGNDFYIQGLPFAPISVSSPNGINTGSVRTSNITFSGYLTANLIDNTTYFRLLECISGSGTDQVRVTEVADNAADLSVTITYFTSA